jgi:hypothetical protein
MKTYTAMEVKLLSFLTSKFDGAKWSVPYSERFNSDAYQVEGYANFRADLDAVMKKRKPTSTFTRSRSPVVLPVASH